MHPHDEDEEGLLDRCVRGDEAAWRDIVLDHYSMVAGVCRRILARRGVPHGPLEVDEAVADFFGDLCLRREQTLGSFRGRSLQAFLARKA
jgi:DNA-directed RNA polymerase specialized sigma24 family protein